jgi:hypothetical protein
VCFNPRTGGWILLKFGTDVMPIGGYSTLIHFFFISYDGNTKVMDEWICDVMAVTLAPLYIVF